MAGRTPVIAIVGRTNVGKSTLFNLLSGRKMAVVDDVHGVTRDRNYALVKKNDTPFYLVDTGGLIGEENEGMLELVRSQTEIAIEEADFVIAVFDGMHGVHPHDAEVAELLRRAKKETIWVVNKCEKQAETLAASEFYQLGCEELIEISATHNKGTRKLLEAINQKLAELNLVNQDTESEDNAIKVAIVGKPNVGKSTLVNRILGEDRVVTSDVAGTTRDGIDVPLKRDGQEYVLVDTAGLRKKRKIAPATVERYSSLSTMRALARCNVAVLVIDATLGPPTEQDVKIGGLIHERGRAFVIAVNKWDAIEKDHKSAKEFKDKVFEAFKFAKYAPVIFISALTGKRCPSVLKKVQEAYKTGETRVQTAQLNKVLNYAFEKYPPPVYRGEPVKLFFATQVETSPPKIVLFVSHPRGINFSYKRYVKNSLRKAFPFEGTDLKLAFRKRSDQGEGSEELAGNFE